MVKYGYMTVTYAHDWIFELAFWGAFGAVVLFAWWMIGFKWPEI